MVKNFVSLCSVYPLIKISMKKKRYLLLLPIVILGLTLIHTNGCKKDDCKETNPGGDCICYQVYAPVCGCNRKTYINQCYAKCVGITSYTEGACK